MDLEKEGKYGNCDFILPPSMMPETGERTPDSVLSGSEVDAFLDAGKPSNNAVDDRTREESAH
jgi:hypothetical protein